MQSINARSVIVDLTSKVDIVYHALHHIIVQRVQVLMPASLVQVVTYSKAMVSAQLLVIPLAKRATNHKIQHDVLHVN
jgi:hypothetical protein